MNLKIPARGAFLLVLMALLAACGSGSPTTSQTTDIQAIEIQSDDFDLQGHRGARGLKPENTLPGFETALDLGVTTLELDLHYTADGDIVVWHDPVIVPEKCRRPEGFETAAPDPDDPATPEAGLAVRALTTTELRSLACDRNPDPERFPQQSNDPTALAGADFGIVTLDELFEFVDRYASSAAKTDAQREGARNVLFNIETKRRASDPTTIDDGFDGVAAGPFETRILEVIEARDLGARVVIQSFDRRSLEAIHRADPTIPLAALTALGDDDLNGYARLGISIWSPKASTVTPELVEEAHAAGLSVVPWTVNDPAEMVRLIEYGIDGLITDRPDLLVRDS